MTTMEELAKKVLELYVAKSDIMEEFRKHPFECGNYVYAVGEFSGIRIAKQIAGTGYDKKPDLSDRVKNLFNTPLEFIGNVSTRDLTQQAEGSIEMIAGECIRNDEYERIVKTSHLLGVSGFDVYIRGALSHVFMNGGVTIVQMLMVNVSATTIIPMYCGHIEEGFNPDYGYKYLKELERTHDGKKDNIYAVTIARFATMYVEAGDPKEAMYIAEEHKRELNDTDYEDEAVDSCETYATDPEDFMKKIYTSEGVFSVEEYMEGE